MRRTPPPAPSLGARMTTAPDRTQNHVLPFFGRHLAFDPQ